MIIFDLRCHCGYQFEGWFADHTDYARQQGEGVLICPNCGDSRVQKILSPVAMVGRGRQQQPALPSAQHSDQDESQLRSLLTEVRAYIDRNFEDVGANFAATALKIHYGVEEPRDIRGVVTDQEETMLNGEGIHLMKVPVIKKGEGGQ